LSFRFAKYKSFEISLIIKRRTANGNCFLRISVKKPADYSSPSGDKDAFRLGCVVGGAAG
jgi:hypothetical protein